MWNARVSEQDDGHDYDEPLLGVALTLHLLRGITMPRSRTPNNASTARRLQRVMDYVQEHFTRDLSLTELASVAGVSPSHLKTVFRRTTGLPVHQYIIRLRV